MSNFPLGFPNPSYYQVQTRQDVCYPDGALKVQKGAKGLVVGSDQGLITVLFDEGQNLHIEPDGGGRLIQRVPVLATTRLM